MIIKPNVLSQRVLVRVLICPHCKRLRESEYLGASARRSLWRCNGCEREFHLGPALTASLLSEEVVYG